jgi:hypothetical protein
MSVLLSVALIVSYRELNELNNRGIKARDALHFDKYDFIFFIAVMVTWQIVKISALK